MRNIQTIRAQNIVRGFGIALVATLLLVGTGTRLEAESQPVPHLTSTISTAPDAACTANGSATVAEHSQTGAVRFVGTEAGQTLWAPKAENAGSPELAAGGYLAVCGSMFGLENAARDLTIERAVTDPDGRSMVRYQQTYNGVPVLAGELIVNLNSNREVTSVIGEMLPNIRVDTQPRIDANAAKASAAQQLAREYNVDAGSLIVSEPSLWIYSPTLLRPGGGFTQLVWRMEVTHPTKLEIRALTLINAQRGSMALTFNQTDFALNRRTYDANNGTALPGTLRCNESNPTCSGGDTHEVAAHKYAGDTYNYYSSNFGRDSIDNAGMILISSVHYSNNYFNAFWSGAQMVYGDDAGFPLADDVVGHELTHGVTEHESGLFYYYQSGAINESLSDVFGELMDLTNGSGTDTAAKRWKMGEDILGYGELRDMEDPPVFGDPDRMTSPNYYTALCANFSSNCDNGGVHFNSGVNNKAAFLMTDGATFNGKTVTGLGISKVGKIYYEAQRHLLVSGSDYSDLYNALYQACQNLIPGAVTTASDCQEVRDATDAVEMNGQPIADYNVDAAVCPTGNPNNVFFDDMESGSGKWTFGGIVGATHWSLDNPYFDYDHSGNHHLYGDDYSNSNSDSFAAMNASVALPANAYLHFYHAYGFQDPNYDGGILEYSTNNGGSWTNAGSLIEVNGYDGALAASNPLGAVQAWRSDSHGYISSRVNLASLAGQSVRFRWRLAVDKVISIYEGYDRGWFLDDVRIYTCATGTVGPVTVTQVRVTDNSNVDQTVFNRGDKLRYHVTLNNAGTLACSVTVRYLSKNGGTVLHDQTKVYNVNPGDNTFFIKKKIPGTAAILKYKLKVSSDCNGQKSSKSKKFDVVP